MKKLSIAFGAVAIATAGLFLTSSCKQGGKSSGEQSAAGGAIVSAEKNSFNEVTAKLDKGGDFYMYLSTEQWLKGVSENIGRLRNVFMGLPNVKSEDREKIEKVFDVVEGGVKESGIEKISGVGMSSIAQEKGFYHSKFILHHYKGDKGGFLWSLFGKEPHTLEGLDLLPANTAMAGFSELDVPQLWTLLSNGVANLNIPEANQALDQFPKKFAAGTGMTLEQLLGSLDGEYGIVLTLDEAKQIPVPLGTNALKVPEPGLMIIAKVKNDTLFNQIDTTMKGNSSVIRVDKPDLKMRTMPLPLPLPIQLRPTVAQSGQYLFVATTDALIQEALAVKSGQKPGWKKSEEYQKLSKGLPTKGNSFFFIGRKLGSTIADVQKAAVSMRSGMNSPQTEALQNMFAGQNPMYSFSIAANTDEGWEVSANGNQSLNQAALIPGAAAIGLLTAIAVPNFVKARTTAQKNACINNLRQIDGAKEQWALENKKDIGSTPTGQELWGPNAYMRRQPVCPAGGTYQINPVGTAPTCSHEGHELPK